MLDNNEINVILEKLESLEDENLAVDLLRQFNAASVKLGKLLMNLDNSLSHDEWKAHCDQAQNELDKIIKIIQDL